MAIQDKLKSEELNKYAIDKIKYLTEHKYFKIIKQTDKEMALNHDPFAKGFYLSRQDKISEAYGEILIAFRKLKARLLVYIAYQKFQKAIEAETNKKKLPGNDILEDMIRGEVLDLYHGMLILKGWVERGENSIRTCRSHSYGNNEEPGDKEDKEPGAGEDDEPKD
jgi:hypothetical protein